MKLSRHLSQIGLWCLLFSSMLAQAGDAIVKLDRAGKSPLFYIATTPEAPTKVGAILFAGGDGALKLAEAGMPPAIGNFLIRSRGLFAERGIATASFDPSGESGSLSDSVRKSSLHAEEVAEVLADFKRRFGLDYVHLIGTSRGTVSAASVALPLQAQISGVVLSSTVFSGNRQGNGLAGFDFARIQVPLLFVHHRHDGCKVTQPSDAERMQDRYTVVFIDGGGTSGDVCGPFHAHGYEGKEAETVGIISDWILAHMPAKPKP